eukprot:CAMPEP_0119085542 /NCGR_PEP_ID=MMETSP1178-20130426/134307_1 /TAXON_ID=33656 /ORGANISM="unid sp, Strain CCMP2000" /LENGTH=60 /DNA_ID=CAMNT_0007068607 /DNA_START=47 /DNA_END=229 /DNA_ORIENTATION=-
MQQDGLGQGTAHSSTDRHPWAASADHRFEHLPTGPSLSVPSTDSTRHRLFGVGGAQWSSG